MRQKIKEVLQAAVNQLGVKEEVELTASKSHGDFSTNIALKLTKKLGKNPKDIATKIIENVDSELIDKISIDGPGFINIFLNQPSFSEILNNILEQDGNFGKSHQGKYINIEYVSANPTGYLHLGHAKNAAIGSALVNILRFAGNKVDSEYYINDAGNQIDILGYSTFLRYQELLGAKITLPEDSYKGQDIVDVAEEIKNDISDKYFEANYEDVKEFFKETAKGILLNRIKEHLAQYNVTIDNYYSEESIYKDNLIKPTLEALKEWIYVKEGATWLKTTSKGDDKDRVLIKQDGEYTYFLPDVAYHKVKLDRGYNELINVWGSDHIGYIKRLSVALEFLGLPSDKLDIVVVQLVKLFKNNQELKMSKRKGTTYQLIDLINEVGVDSARWFMLDGAINSELIFDLDKAIAKNNDNPVFFVQYSYARANQLLAKLGNNDTEKTYDQRELNLINELSKFPQIVLYCANKHKVNILTQYLINVAKVFNSWYSNSKAVGSPKEKIIKDLVKSTMIVVKNGLDLLGVSAPKSM